MEGSVWEEEEEGGCDDKLEGDDGEGQWDCSTDEKNECMGGNDVIWEKGEVRSMLWTQT